MNPTCPGVRNLRWLLSDLLAEAPGIRQAVVVSSDGVPLASTHEPVAQQQPDGPRGAGVQLATVVSGLVSLAYGGSELLEQGEPRHAVVTMEYGHLLVMAFGDGSCLGVHACLGSELSAIGYQMALFVERVGHVLTPGLRRELRTAAER